MTDDSGKHEQGRQSEEEVNQFEKLASRAREIFEESSGRSREAFEAALDRAKREMVAAGEMSSEMGERLRAYVQRDLHATREELDEVLNKYRPEAERAGYGLLGLMHSVTEAMGGLLSGAASSMQRQLTYRTGEICGPGTLTCTGCGKSMKKQKTGHVPPCPGCAGTEFRRSY